MHRHRQGSSARLHSNWIQGQVQVHIYRYTQLWTAFEQVSGKLCDDFGGGFYPRRSSHILCSLHQCYVYCVQVTCISCTSTV